MLLKSILYDIDYKVLQGNTEIDIVSVTWDTRDIEHGTLFVCVKGKNIDRHKFAPLAAEMGASAIIVDDSDCIGSLPQNITIIEVKDSKIAMGHIANTFYKNPSSKCNLIGIMGKSGKTSTAWITAKILSSCGRNVGVIESVGNIINDDSIAFRKMPSNLPDSIGLQSTLSQFISEGITDVIVEISASALSEQKYYGCEFDLCMLTNSDETIYQELIQNGKFISPYEKLLDSCKSYLINADGTLSDFLMNNVGDDRLTFFGTKSGSGFIAENIVYSIDNTTFEFSSDDIREHVKLNVPGRFFLENALAAMSCCCRIGIDPKKVIEVCESIGKLNGIFEVVPNPENHTVIIDSAFSPSDVKNLLKAVKEIVKGRIITVFGCGGDREKSRRIEIGEEAGRYSDYCIITLDNPRTESPDIIIRDIETGIRKTSCKFEKISDRKSAVYHSIDLLKKDDAVVIFGKGHEIYQIFANSLVHYSDIETVKSYYSKKYC